MKSTTPRVWWRLLMPLVLMSLVLAACAGSPPSIAGEASPSALPEGSVAATVAPAQTAIETATATTGGRDPALHPEVTGTITFWHFWSSAVRRTAIRHVIGECKKQLPGIHVREVAKPYGDIWTDNMAAVTEGTGMPDVIVEDRPQLPDRAINGIVQSIGSLAERDGIDGSQFWPFTWRETLYEGEPYGVPFETDVRVLYYNKDAFREVGLDPEKPPQTWEELEAYADKLDRKKADGSYDRIAFFPMLKADPNVWGFANGVQWTDTDGKPRFNSPETVATIEWIKRWVDRYGGLESIDTFRSQFTSAPNDPFMTGRLAMFADINGYSSQLKFYSPRTPLPDGTSKPMEWGVARLPSNGMRGSWSGGFALSIPRGAEHPEAAWEFIKCATSVAPQTVWARETLSLPANIAAANDPALMEDPSWQMFVDAMQTTSGSVFVPSYPNWYEQLDMRYPAIWRGELSAQEAVDQAQAIVDAELSKQP